MAFIVADRVKETSTTTGTGDLTLAGAVTGFQTFDAPLASSDTTYYAIEAVDGNGIPTGEWEVGLGTFTSPATLARTTVIASSNSGAAVNLSAGTKNVFMTGPAARYGYFPNGLEVGHDSDTSVTRSAAGVLAVEGTIVAMTGKQTIWVPALAMHGTSTSSAGAALVEYTTNDENVFHWDFDDAADEYVQFQVAFPKSWDESTVTFQVWWTSTGAVTTGVAWGLQGYAFSDSDALDVAWGTPVVVTDDALGTANDVYVTAESSAVTIGGTPAEGDVVLFRLFRDVSDANDDMTQDARLIGIKIFASTNAGNDA